VENIKMNNIVIFNFEIESQKSKYNRIKSMGINKVSEIMFMNMHIPHYYFNIIDPDGNI
jgi:lactoylglutathione lyase